MADPTAILSQGTTFTFNSVALGGVRSVSGIGSGTASKIPITTLASTIKEWKQGLRDGGEFTVEFSRRNEDDLGQAAITAALAAQTTAAFVVTLSSSTANVITFNAFVVSFTSEVEEDGVVTGKAVFCQTSPSVYT